MEERWTNKWKAPPWMKPGARVRVFKGRKFPIGTTGTLVRVQKTGHGAEGVIQFDDGCGVNPARCMTPEFAMHRQVSVLNLEPDPRAVS